MAASWRQAPGDGRIPAGELGAAHDHFAQRARLHQLAHLLVIDVLPHAPGEHEFHPGFGAGGFHLVHFLHGNGDGLLARHMFAGLGGLHGLAAMDVLRRGDIDRLHILRQQLCLGRAGVRARRTAAATSLARCGLMSITETSSALETIFLNSGMVRRAAMPPQPITPHLIFLLITLRMIPAAAARGMRILARPANRDGSRSAGRGAFAFPSFTGEL